MNKKQQEFVARPMRSLDGKSTIDDWQKGFVIERLKNGELRQKLLYWRIFGVGMIVVCGVLTWLACK